MSAITAGVCELTEADRAALFVREDGLMYASDVPLPGLFYSDELLDDSAFMRFSRANRPLQFERYPQAKIVVWGLRGLLCSSLEVYLAARLATWAEATDSGTVFGSNCGFKFDDGSVLAADASWIAASRWAVLTEPQREEFVPFAPDFLIELRSPKDPVAMLEAKMRLCMSKGVTLAWMIDPQRKLAAIYRQEREPETLSQPEFLVGEGPVAGFQLEMKRFWL